MASRGIHSLSAVGVTKLKAPGYHSDGGGLYLQVSPTGSKSWIFRFKLHGRSREMGLGSINALSLADARSKAADCRRLLVDGIDPIEARKAGKAKSKLDAAKAMTFAECAAAYLKAQRSGWKSAVHAQQWENSIETYANPVLGPLPVQEIDTDLVMRVLEPIWSTKAVTAGRVRARIESVLDWAKVRTMRDGENPARWRGHLESLLPKKSNVATVVHHPALPYTELGAFMRQLRAQEGVAARALEFTILTAARSGETNGAVLDEFDLGQKLWVVPAGRMKKPREHRIPLSKPAIEIIEQVQKDRKTGLVFEGMDEHAMLTLVKTMRPGVTVHGFRSTFRDWVADRTGFTDKVAEAALAHAKGDKVEEAYRRTDLFEKRRRLMVEWAKFCSIEAKSGSVLSINAA